MISLILPAVRRDNILKFAGGKAMGNMIVEVFGMTDIGMRRELNEDSFRVCGFEDGKPLGFCVLADGMGGHNAGEVASQNTVNSIADELLEKLGEPDDEQVNLDIAAAIDFANAKVYGMSMDNPEQAGMGTTTVIAYIKDGKVKIANIGDSRAYVISEKKIYKITTDHSVVEQLIQSGTISPEEARRHPDKNIITRALGTEEFVDADFYEYIPQTKDVILLCSDGLTEMLYEHEIKDIVNKSDSMKNAVSDMVAKANERGGVDNITVVAVQFKEEEAI